MVDNCSDSIIYDHLGIIAGGGILPQKIINSCKQRNFPYTVIALKGHADSLKDSPSIWITLGEAGKAFDKMREEGVKDIVMAGKVIRPSLVEFRPDWRTIKFLAKIGRKAFIKNSPIGDDNLLRLVISEIEKEGFNVIGQEDLLSDLLMSEGLVGNITNITLDNEDISLGVKSAREIGREDKGQAVVVQGGAILSTEGMGGTDDLIQKSSKLKNDGPGPILVKLVKPEQDRRVDLPFIGVNTVNLCAEAGFRGIVIEAQGTLLGDPDMIIKVADMAGIFILAVECSNMKL